MIGWWVMLPLKTREELALLIDLLREKSVAHFEMGDLKIILGGPEGELEEEAPQEEPSKLTGLTPSQEEELFHSSK